MSIIPRLRLVEALPSSRPHPCLGEQAKVFDRFVGAWAVECVFYSADGTKSEFVGEWVFGWILDGRIMQDVLSGYPKGSPPRSPEDRRCGTSLRFYDPKTGLWNVVWLGSRNGFLLALTGGADGDRIVLHGDDVDGARMRWSFNDIRAESFVWRGETSPDQGKTWRIELEMFLKRHPG